MGKSQERRNPSAVAALTVPACAFCAGLPVVAGHLILGGVLATAVGWGYHLLLALLVPINLALLWIDYRVHHRQRLPLVLGAVGSAMVLAHVAQHLAENSAWDGRASLAEPMWGGMVLLFLALALDFYWVRSSRRRGAACEPEAYWRSVLTGTNPGLRAGRRIYGALPARRRCKLCRVPVAGRMTAVMRLVGKAPSDMNPNFCGDCLSGAPLGGAEIDVSLLFVDVRGSTTLAERIGASAFVAEINAFYERTTAAIVDYNGLVDKLVGDEVIGLFLEGFAGPSHARAALDAAARLLRDPPLPIGVAVHTGVAYVGIVGADPGTRDLTAMGDVMNTAARLVSLADTGELCLSEAAAHACGLDASFGNRQEVQVRGRSAPVAIRLLDVRDAVALSGCRAAEHQP